LIFPSTGGDIAWLDDDALIAMLDELLSRPMLAGKDGLRLSLEGNRIGLPRNGTPSSHILKPAILAVEDSVTNEGVLFGVSQNYATQARSLFEKFTG